MQDKEITQVEMEDAEPDPQDDLEIFDDDDEDEVRKSWNSTPEGLSYSSSDDQE